VDSYVNGWAVMDKQLLPDTTAQAARLFPWVLRFFDWLFALVMFSGNANIAATFLIGPPYLVWNDLFPMEIHPMQFQSLYSRKTVSVAVAAALLSACGGGGSSSDDGYSDNGSDGGGSDTTTITAANISNIQTPMGATYTVDGKASVLLSQEAQLSVTTADYTDLTLYTFDKDAVDQSACVDDKCITTWPPLLAADSDVATAPLGIFEREDGHKQWTLHGMPLYFFNGDSAPGQVNGEGVGGVWHTAVADPVDLQTNDTDGVYLAAAGQVLTTSQPTMGTFVAGSLDKSGFALYTFDKDEYGVSNCNDACLNNWPALLAQEGDRGVAPYSLIERTLGTDGAVVQQWALHGMPLYFFLGDDQTGDTNGTAIDLWRLARPAATRLAASERGSYLTANGLVLQSEPEISDAASTEATEAAAAEVTRERPLDGMALYTFDSDEPGVSKCTDGCLTRWPALIAREGAEAQGAYSLIERSSGEKQWALNGMPLYFYYDDLKAGDTNGDEVGQVWRLARPVPVATLSYTGEYRFVAHGALVNEDGVADTTWADFSLYTFDSDNASGKSVCFGACATRWPPLYATRNDQDFGDFSVIQRDDPATDAVEEVYQWAYKNEPLYFYFEDSAPGDLNGDGVNGVWHLARP